MKKYMLVTFAVIGIVLLLIISIVSTRIKKDIYKKLAFENTYAIQNVASNTCIRPFNADYKNDTKIIGYSHKNWECITWEMIALGNNIYLLKNLFTEKTFQPVSEPKVGVPIWQKPLGGTVLQYWEFLKQTDGTHLIRLKNTDLYLTILSNEINSPILLMPLNNSNTQKWKLIKQTPWI